ncbi:MAG TPA: glycosyltransferase [Trebonia sp.]|nr:glycosyltransferase [Trebonia sp.]
MKILVLPREETNPYQDLLYGEMRRRGARISYLARLTPSQTVNVLLLPAELAMRRLGGARVVHLHWVYAFGVPAGARFRLVRRAMQAWFAVWLWTLRVLGMRLVWTAHNVLPVTPVFTDDLGARKRLVATCDLVIAHSKATLDQLADLGIVPRRSAVIPHGPFESAVAPASLRAPGQGQGPRRLLFFGKIRPYKGVDTLLTAFAALPPDLDVHLTVAGECGDETARTELARLAAKSGDRVTLRLERIPETAVTQLLQQADAMILPYRRITTSGSAVLGLCHGRPLVVPDLPGLAELPDDAVIRYDGTVQGLTGALTSIALADASVLAAMSSAASAYCAAISWSEIAERTLTEISEMLGNNIKKS